MTTWAAVLLILNALFNVVAWPAFFRRVVKDPRARDRSGRATPFLRVHAVLVGVALVLAAASAVVAVVMLTTG